MYGRQGENARSALIDRSPHQGSRPTGARQVGAPHLVTHEGAARPRLTVVYGGGLQFGIAYGLGVADALMSIGIPLPHVSALGVSAGAWVAACVATGTTIEVLCAIPQVRVPNPRPGVLRKIARTVFGNLRDARVSVAAVQLPALTRQVLSGASFPLADLIAASSSVPGLFAPSPVGGKWYVDGMARRGCGADRAPAADNLLVVSPLAGPMFGPVGRLMEILLMRELDRWSKATGGRAHLIRPSSEITALMRHPLDLLDQRLAAREVYPRAYEQTLRHLATRPELSAAWQVDCSGARDCPNSVELGGGPVGIRLRSRRDCCSTQVPSPATCRSSEARRRSGAVR